MTRWSYVLLIVTSLLTPRSASRDGSAASYSVGNASAPTPTIVPCPVISLGTDCWVPIVPGLVMVTVTPCMSSALSRFSRILAICSS